MKDNDLLDALIESVMVEERKQDGLIRLPMKQVQTIEVQVEDNKQMPEMRVGEAVRGDDREAYRACEPKRQGWLNKLELR